MGEGGGDSWDQLVMSVGDDSLLNGVEDPLRSEVEVDFLITVEEVVLYVEVWEESITSILEL